MDIRAWLSLWLFTFITVTQNPFSAASITRNEPLDSNYLRAHAATRGFIP